MSYHKCQNVVNVQAKLKLHIEELENALKYDNIYWENYNLDNVPLKNVIENHHTEIMHHIEQIRYHLDKVDRHKNQLDDIVRALSIGPKKSGTLELEDESPFNQGDPVKRPDDEKLRFKVRRVSKTSPLKYVLQWENFLEDQKEENAVSSVQYRNKHKSSSSVNVSTSHTVKNRIEKFEGFHKPKRQSSTIETFLDFSGEKPRRIKSYPIIEDAEEENESEVVKSIDSNSNSEPEILTKGKVAKCDNGCAKSDAEERQFCFVVEDSGSSSATESTKPKIIEMHYKQHPTTTENH